MHGHSQGEQTDAALVDIPAPEVLARLVPYLDMSVMVVRRDWTVAADLGPPGGVLGRGNATGGHPFRSMHPDDVERIAGYAQRAMESDPGWRGSFEVRAQRGDGSYGLYDVELHNRLDDPVLQGIVVVSRPLPDPQPGDAPSLPAEVAASVQLGAGDHLPIGLLLLDSEGDVVFVNQMAVDLLGTDRDSLLDGFVPAGFAAVDQEEILAILHRLRAAPGRESFTAALLGDAPRLLSATFVSRAGEGTGDRVQFVVVTLEDVTHRLAHERHLEHRANHDSLTGCPTAPGCSTTSTNGWLRDPRWSWPTSISTASRPSTTAADTPPATTCSPRWPGRWPPASVRARRWPGWAATSSWWWPTPTPRRPPVPSRTRPTPCGSGSAGRSPGPPAPPGRRWA
jgi:hypothetical protein